MLRLCRVTKVKVFFLVLAYVFDFYLFEFLAAILEKGLLVSKAMVCYFEVIFRPILCFALFDYKFCSRSLVVCDFHVPQYFCFLIV